MTEQQVQRKLMKKLESEGYYVLKLIKTNKNGIPDLLAIKKNSLNNDQLNFIEVKKKGGIASRLQEFRIKELNTFGINSFIYEG